MKETTRYRYEKRIKILSEENENLRSDLHQFRTACSEIYDGLVDAVKKNEAVPRGWVLERLKRAWRS